MDLFKVLGGQEADFNTNAWKYVTDVLSSSTVKVGTYLIIFFLIFEIAKIFKKAENEIIDSINEKINSVPEILYNRVLVLSGENWSHGVIGIVASRMVERFDKPCFMITIEGEISRGSARSFGDFSIFKALDYCSDLLIKYGGHLGAGGFSIETSKIEDFNKRIQEFAEINFRMMPVPDITADKLILPDEINVNNIDLLFHHIAMHFH